jgi:5'(3')-deoxyribonucleotidase
LNNVAVVPYDELITVGHDDTKIAHLVDVLFDDAPHHVENAIAEGQNAVIFDQAWNRHLSYPRVYGWKGIREYIDENFPVRNTNVMKKGLTI